MPRLLDGCSFFLRGMFNPPTVNKQDLIKLIQLGGGKLLHREPKVRDDDLISVPSSPIVTSISRAPEVAYHAPANSTLSCCTEFILYDSVSGDQPKIVYSPVLRTAPVTWLMDCISSFQFLDIPDVEIVYIPDVEM
jgi:BRCA1-associated RING domain protein 1